MLGERIKQIRKEKSLSQQAFAALLSTSSGYISEVEKGKTIPGGTFFRSLKRAFPEVDLNWVLTGDETPSNIGAFIIHEDQDVDERNTPIPIRIKKMVENLDHDSQYKVLLYVEEQELLRQMKEQLQKQGVVLKPSARRGK